MIPTPLNADPWMTPLEVTTEYAISKATLSEWRAKRINIPFRQVGRAIHYRRSAVETFVASKMIQIAS
jgi:hypothetical protein